MRRVLISLLCLGLWGCRPDPAPPETPPILLVVLDTVRADRTSTYGYTRPTTVQLDAVARMMSQKRTAVVVKADRIVSWDHRKLGGRY